MTEPRFGSDGIDLETFAPFVLFDARDSEWKDVRLSFDDWERLHQFCDDDDEADRGYLNGYYLNGYGVEGLVKACRLQAGLDPEAEGIDYNSEGDTCYIHFADLADAVATARIASDMIRDRDRIVAMIEVAREHGFED